MPFPPDRNFKWIPLTTGKPNSVPRIGAAVLSVLIGAYYAIVVRRPVLRVCLPALVMQRGSRQAGVRGMNLERSTEWSLTFLSDEDAQRAFVL
ncbi:MAG: hypothetical protein IT428_19830 [Planctomycetaceae bacterium]|nr:hypothetical protein [Planctomycetaceae bacterium]